MAPYFPVKCHRSDGQLEIITKSGLREPNQPTNAQLDSKPDKEGMVDCYRRLDPNDSKAVDWRRKIGGMLMHLLGGKEHADRNYILEGLPDGYVLWEHVKYKVNKTGEDRKNKHAAGVFERQDAYLYGHPHGRKKRYRSPADFFPHVLWLATDKEGDPRNCSCKICSPDGDEEAEPQRLEPNTLKRDTKHVPSSSPAQTQPTTVSKPPIPASAAVPKGKYQDISSALATNIIAASAAASTVSKPTFQPSTNGPKQSAEQRLDAEANGKFLYRPGELVWFNKGQAWGLAVISKRRALYDKPQYLVQPLSHPLSHPPYQIKDQEEQLRPWLAWSVPATTHSEINILTYEQVPWDRVIRGEFGGGDAVVDGSILAAKAIDASFSLFDRVENALVGPGEVQYTGMFLGAEKVWVGEPVRLRVSDDKVIMVLIIHKLIEQTTPPSTSNVTFVGDIYKLNDMPTPYKSRADWPTPALPPRLVADIRFRNEVADRAKRGTWYEWQLLEPAGRRSVPDIKGRWYETQTLLPILRPGGMTAFQQALITGDIDDVSKWMNGRGDSSTRIGQRRKNRKDTIGRAVPADFKVSRGLDGSPADNVFPDAQQQSQPPLVHSDIIDSDRF